MPRQSPEAAIDDPAPVRRVGDEATQLGVGDGLDHDGRRRHDDGDRVEDTERPAPTGHDGPDREHGPEDDDRRHQLDADQVDQPPRQYTPGGPPDLGVAPVHRAEPPPGVRPVPGQPHRPGQDQDRDDEFTRVGSPTLALSTATLTTKTTTVASRSAMNVPSSAGASRALPATPQDTAPQAAAPASR